MKQNTTLYLTRGALIAALYVALTYLCAMLGLASGVIQLRLSEALTVMVLFMPEAVIGLTIGCLIANILTGALIWDVIFGTLATLLGAVGGRFLRKLPSKLIWIATLPTVLSNSIIIPFVLIWAYGVPDTYFFIMLTVAIGEIISAGVLGTLLYFSLKKTKFIKDI